MHLVSLTKTLLSLSFIACIAKSTFGQDDTTKYKIESKYKAEYTPYFKFNTFFRGEDAQVLKIRLDSLSNKNKDNWTRNDSLSFAKTNLLAGNTKLAEHYFSNIVIDPKLNYEDNLHDLCAIYVSKDFSKGIGKIKRNYPRIIQYSEKFFLKNIFDAQDSLAQDPSWYKTNPTIFYLKIDTNLLFVEKNSDRFNNEVIIPLNKATSVLKLLVFYVHEDDPVIARSFNDIGVVLEKYVHLSQAYIAYSIGRSYNKRDKEILENIKRVKSKLVNKNYKIPNFRKYFPKIKQGRFDYEILKEKIILGKNDTIVKHKPIVRAKEVKRKLPFPAGILIPIGLLFLFFIILFFVKTRKK
jgi:hypothetical protein